MKSVLISIQPKWVELIASGKKTIEVRKIRPKLETPFKCYIYCTKEKRKDDFTTISGAFGLIRCPECAIYNRAKEYDGNGKVVGEFVCDSIDEYTAEFVNDGECYEDIRRKWIDDDGEEDFEIITSNDKDNPEDCELLKNSCLAYAELKKYIGENFHDIPFYGWHISDLKIYDKPKELSEFYSAKWDMPCENKKRGFNMDFCMAYENGSHFCKELNCDKKRLTRPPQSWCYVESLGE